MVDVRKTLDTESAGFKNRYVDYRKEVQNSKNFENKLHQMSGASSPEAAAKAANPQLTQMAAQQAVIEGQELPNDQLSPKMTQYMALIKQAATKHNLPPELIAGVIWQESRANPNAVSHCGAQGLMQLMPETAARLGVTNSFDPSQNIEGGAKYLRQMLDRFGKLDLAIAAYNAGPGNIEKYGRNIPPFKETQEYVPRVLEYATNFKASGLFVDSTTTMRA